MPTSYQAFVDGILGLPFDTRRDILNIAAKNDPINPYHYLFDRVKKQDVDDPIYLLLLENNILTREMIKD